MDDRKVDSDPETEALLMLAIGMSTGSVDEAADAVERMAQNQAVTSTQLPTEGSPGHGRRYGSAEELADIVRAWKETGIEFGEVPTEGDKLFRGANLPPGWERRSTSHHLWNEVVDRQGRKRVSFFYKGAMWDREAFMNLVNRFYAKRCFHEVRDFVQAQVLDADKEVFATEMQDIGPEPDYEKNRKAWGAWVKTKEAAEEKHVAECVAWLDERYADWRKPWGHWND